MKVVFVFAIVFLVFFVKAQQSGWMLDTYTGFTRLAQPGAFNKSGTGFRFATGCSYRFVKKESSLFFQPGICFTRNSYRVHLTDYVKVLVSNSGGSFIPATALMISRMLFIKSGLVFSIMQFNLVELVYKQNSTYFRFSNHDIPKNYSPVLYQAGLLGGFSFFPGKGRVELGVLFQYIASSLVKSDFKMRLQGAAFESPVLSVDSRAWITSFSLGFSLINPNKQ